MSGGATGRTRAGAKSQTDTHHPDENAVTVFDTRPWGVKAACQTSSPTGRSFSHLWRGSDGKLKLAPPARHVGFFRSRSIKIGLILTPMRGPGGPPHNSGRGFFGFPAL